MQRWVWEQEAKYREKENKKWKKEGFASEDHAQLR